MFWAILFAAAALALVVVGVEALVGRIAGGAFGGLLTLVVAPLVAYVAYVLARSALRIHAGINDEARQAAARRAFRSVAAFTVVLVAGDLVAPLPAPMK